MWKKLLFLMTLILLPALCDAARAADYYVDSVSGNDANSGTSPEQAWKSLAKVNSVVFTAGDRILFKTDTEYIGRLRPQGSGAEGNPIVIDIYGDGDKPCIDANGLFAEAVLLYNVEYWEVNNLEITNWTSAPLPLGKGVYIHINDFGTAHHIHLKNLYIHDIRGDGSGHANDSGDGINWLNEGIGVYSRFDGLVIENCHIARCDLDGIWGWSEYWARDNWYPSLNVVIRGNLVEDVGLHGIVPIGCDGALVEYNVLNGAAQLYDSACGIWPWSCDNTIVQFNEASDVRGNWDGWGFDSDWNSQNNVFQYNYSHDNEVGFMLVCSPAKQTWNIGTIGTIVRYNISENDGWGASDHYPATFRIIGACENTYVYGNTIYLGASIDIPLLDLGYSWGGAWASGNYFYNNIFYVDGQASHTFGSSTNNVFSNNVWYGNHTDAPYDPNAIMENPMLMNPNSGGNGMDTLDGYQLLAGSPCIDAGTDIPDSGGWDFWGNKVPHGDGYDVGAHEYTPLVAAAVDITPRTLNLKSNGRWITCHISLPQEYDVADIEPNSLLLEYESDAVEAERMKLEDQENVAIAKFSRSEVQDMLAPGNVELTISGELIDGTGFEGADTIRVIDKGKRKQARLGRLTLRGKRKP